MKRLKKLFKKKRLIFLYAAINAEVMGRIMKEDRIKRGKVV